MRIALGLDVTLERFALGLSAQNWREFAGDDPEGWRARFLEVMDADDAAIFFNLDGVDVWKGLTRAASGRGGPTDWELLQIQQNPHLVAADQMDEREPTRSQSILTGGDHDLFV